MENPFIVLPISPSATQNDILREVTVAMRARRHDAKRIASAQRILFDPLTRATAEFRYLLDVEFAITELSLPTQPSENTPPPLLDPFEEARSAS